MRVLVLSVNSAWNVVNFRAGLVAALQKAGFHVVVLAPADDHARRVRELGCELIPLRMNAHGVNPVQDLQLLFSYWRLLRRLRPAAFLGFTIKPNVYGSLAAQLLGIPVVNNIAGLGTAFIRRGWLNRVARFLYRSALRRSHRVFFQNRDDRALFVDAGLVAPGKTAVLPGSGVDLDRFSPVASASEDGRPLVALMCARLLLDKGVREFAEAFRMLRARGIHYDARLLGFLDEANPAAVPRPEIEAWQREGLVSFLGAADDVRPHLAEADVVVLPSYREGTPRSLLEAAAMGKPLITTDAPGCRDVVRHGDNGYQVPVRDARALADALARFAALPAVARKAMGVASRRLVEEEYDERVVIRAYLDAVTDAVNSCMMCRN